MLLVLHYIYSVSRNIRMTKEKEHVRLYLEFASHRVASSLVVMMEETDTRPDIFTVTRRLSVSTGKRGGVDVRFPLDPPITSSYH